METKVINITRVESENIEVFHPLLTLPVEEMIRTAPTAVALGAYDEERDNLITGVIVGLGTDEGMRVTYLYVVPQERRHGIATDLVDYLAETSLMLEMGALRIEYLEGDEPQGMKEFLDKMGFATIPLEEISYDIKIADAKQLGIFADLSEEKLSTAVVQITEVPALSLKALSNSLYAEGITVLFDLLNVGDYDEELSWAYLEGEEIRALMICSDCADGVNVEYVYSDPKYSTLLLPTMKKLAASMSRKLSDEAFMHILGITDNAVSLLDGIFKDKIAARRRWIARDYEV